MKSTAKIFYGLTVFLFICTVVYIIGTIYVEDAGYIHGLEWAGTTGLVLAMGLTAMLGSYFHLTERRMDILPQDWEEAEVADNAGLYGFFGPSSIWPFAMSMAIALMGIAIAFMMYWLLIMGAVMLIFFGTMLNLQYGLPREKH
ncbi:cytochrome c oxidase subunit 4 [Corynebacterium mendelii]|uniref:Cytochrome c oxidase polypeptide 4 n=1 Tax=Corynebacterium mendelii TaxID=2765362 RepID=A0A939DYC7_9CORY|nr:cytochrome c oxidase subunit 4 [Corynebacterium mendelii]MBN9643065.1 cytochrome c oxidase subunit 4 [Corynebacterium mendelii]